MRVAATTSRPSTRSVLEAASALSNWPYSAFKTVRDAAIVLLKLPFALIGGAPMALVILCSLASSTALNAFVVPALYARFRREPTPEG